MTSPCSITVDPSTGEWFIGDEVQYPLTLKRAAILDLLVEKAGRVVTKKELEARGWAGHETPENNIRAVISLLRKNLREAGSTAVIESLGSACRYRLVDAP